MSQVLIVPGIGISYESKRRIKYASKLSKEYNIPLILSGGKSQRRAHFLESTEAEHMKTHALKLGVSKENIYIEDKSGNTAQNLYYSKKLIESENNLRGINRIGIVDSQLHLLRTLYTAKLIFPNNYVLQGYPLPFFEKDKPLVFPANIFIESAIIPFEIVGWYKTIQGIKNFKKSGNIEDIVGKFE